MSSVKQTLQDRGRHYEGPGGYADTAEISQDLKGIIRNSLNWAQCNLSSAQMESLDMIANKLARVLCGNADHTDTWHDIAGYATLAESDAATREIVVEEENDDFTGIAVRERHIR